MRSGWSTIAALRRSSGAISSISGRSRGRGGTIGSAPARERPTVTFERHALTLEDIVAISHRGSVAALSPDPVYRAFIQRGADFVDRTLREAGVIYGVTTGFGDSVTTVVPPELLGELARNLYTFHGVGLGAFLSPEQTRASMAARLASLARGYSGVSVELLEQLTALLAHDILPLIPSEGSVGAS